MISLKPITLNNINDFKGTSYDKISFEQKLGMIQQSIKKTYNNFYFEFLTVYKNDTIIGFMSLYAHSKHIISCAPEIKEEFKNKGFGFSAETSALKYAKEKGYTIAFASVEDNNKASIALHEKLGFEMAKQYSNKKGKTMRFYIKAL